MGSLAKRMRDSIDIAIWSRVGETLSYTPRPFTEPPGPQVVVKGAFFKRYRVVSLQDGQISAFDLSFDCQYRFVRTLQHGDVVAIEGTDYMFRRHFPEQGDESGLVTLDLATLKLSDVTRLNFSFQNLQSFDAAPYTHLQHLNLQGNNLPVSEVDGVLQALVQHSVDNGTLLINLGANASPSVSGMSSLATLQGRGWSVLYTV